MSNIPSELKYTKSHEWVRVESDGSVTVGISDHAQELLGDIVFVELPEINTDVNLGEDAGVVESVKAASDIYSPISGKIIAVNETLADTPEIINTDPYLAGWIFKLSPSNETDLKQLLDAQGYEELVNADH